MKDLVVDPPNWSGLTDVQIMRLKGACEQRIKLCDKMNQSPLLEAAVFHVLLNNGLRAGELSGVVVQDPFRMGYQGVKTAFAAKNGETVPKRIETEVIFVTADNIDKPEIIAVTSPDISKWLGEK